MIGFLLSLFGYCRHEHMTTPLTPTSGPRKGKTYVTCLDCAREFRYDLSTMTMGEPIIQSSFRKWKHTKPPKPSASKATPITKGRKRA